MTNRPLDELGRRRQSRHLRRRRTTTIGLALAVLLIAGCGGSDGGDSSATTSSAATTTTQQEAVPAVVKVSIGDNFYKPQDVTIRRGQSISWRNDGAVAHTVTSDADSTVKFDSGTLDPRGAYALKPSTAGKLTYYCTIHGKAQSGTITVER